jgi:hypothetical protein
MGVSAMNFLIALALTCSVILIVACSQQVVDTQGDNGPNNGTTQINVNTTVITPPADTGDQNTYVTVNNTVVNQPSGGDNTTVIVNNNINNTNSSTSYSSY